MKAENGAGADQPTTQVEDIPLMSLTLVQFARALAIHSALIAPKGEDGGFLEQAERDARRILSFIEHGTRSGVLWARTPQRRQQADEGRSPYASSSGTGAG